MADSSREHLERLVIEVFGVEEGKRKLDELIKKEEEQAKTMKGLEKQAKELAKTEQEASKKRIEASRKATESIKKGAKIAGVAMLALTKLAADASLRMEQASGRVERSFEKVGASAAEMDAALAGVDASARDLGLGLADQREQLSNLLDATGDVETATRDLALANDIAATGDRDLEQAVELLTKARKGEVSELINLDGFTKDHIDTLNGIEDAATRTEIAVMILNRAYAGSAKELADTNTAMQNFKKAGEDLLVVVGDAGSGLIQGLAELIGVSEPGEDVFLDMSKGLRDFAAEAKSAIPVIKEAASSFGFVGQILRGEEVGIQGFKDAAARKAEAEADSRAAGKFLAAARKRGRGEPEDVDPIFFAPVGPKLKDAGPKDDPRVKKEKDVTDELNDILDQAQADAITRDQENLDRQAIFLNEKTERLKQFERDKVEIEFRGEQLREEERKRAEAKAKKAEEKKKKDTADDAKDAKKEANDIADASIAAGQQLTGAFIKDEGAKAAILGGIEVGQSIRDFATGNIPGGIGHAAAAVQFFAVAAQAGIGGGKTRKGKFAGGGAGSTAPTPPRTPTTNDERIALSGERERDPFARQNLLTINISSAITPHPSQVRQLADELETEARNNTGGFWGRVARVGTGQGGR